MGERAGKRVLASGAFELLHPGHVRFLVEAKRAGGEGSRLVVVVARDETIRRRKGREPILGEEARKEIISMLKPVDEVILGHVPFSFEKVIEEVKPDIVVFGYDQEDLMREFMKFVESRGLNVKVVKLGKFSSQGPSSTSELIRRAAEIMGRGS
ncbi:MAG: FAD synthase, partial [Thaumarchaeota archaeon]|nr:FAD synthase [Nitrososphaerota archaeon]MCL7386033.1 FAD synthase [Candidatus Wolframiiraptor allenii]